MAHGCCPSGQRRRSNTDLIYRRKQIMARKRVEEVIAEFESWDDVNQALGTIGDNQRMVEGTIEDLGVDV